MRAFLMIHRRNFYIWGFLLGLASFFSCQTEDCFSIFNNDLLVDFKETDTLENGRVTFSALDTMFYEIRAVGNDSVLYSLKRTAKTIVLPVNPAEDQTTFEFYTIAAITYDTISVDPPVVDIIFTPNPIPYTMSVSYRRITRVISEPCGVEIGYISLKVDETSFGIANVVRERLSRFNSVNIEIFL